MMKYDAKLSIFVLRSEAIKMRSEKFTISIIEIYSLLRRTELQCQWTLDLENVFIIKFRLLLLLETPFTWPSQCTA